ncbi:hypothetical protein [Aliikangiella maris]|uniref:Uncharacterized protein n=2 Tax=Aliikangiella maris TaxID=3162458 RepID=A0ABV3MS35_9GAMM
MQAYIREKLVDALIESQKLINQYQTNSANFISSTLKWLIKIDDELARLRHPLSSMIAAERGKLLATVEGGNLDNPGLSKRKAERFKAVNIIESVEQKLREAVDQIDSQFIIWRDKIAQLAAISSRHNPISLSQQQIGNKELIQIWQQFGIPEEGINMHQYLSAVMPQADLLYLLDDVVANLLSNRPVQVVQ